MTHMRPLALFLTALAAAITLVAGCGFSGVSPSNPLGGETAVAPPAKVELHKLTDVSSVVITLTRGRCFGFCPAYTVTVRGTGAVEFAGTYRTVVPTATGTVTEAQVRDLLEEFDSASFLTLADRYRDPGIDPTDASSAVVALTVGGVTKSVDHYLGNRSAPPALTTLEQRIDDILGTYRWLCPPLGTPPSLPGEPPPCGVGPSR